MKTKLLNIFLTAVVATAGVFYVEQASAQSAAQRLATNSGAAEAVLQRMATNSNLTAYQAALGNAQVSAAVVGSFQAHLNSAIATKGAENISEADYQNAMALAFGDVLKADLMDATTRGNINNAFNEAYAGVQIDSADQGTSNAVGEATTASFGNVTASCDSASAAGTRQEDILAHLAAVEAEQGITGLQQAYLDAYNKFIAGVEGQAGFQAMIDANPSAWVSQPIDQLGRFVTATMNEGGADPELIAVMSQVLGDYNSIVTAGSYTAPDGSVVQVNSNLEAWAAATTVVLVNALEPIVGIERAKQIGSNICNSCAGQRDVLPAAVPGGSALQGACAA